MQDERFVAGLYRDLLGRTADASEIAGHVAALRGGTPRAALVRSFLCSDEHLARHVDQAYQRYLKRGADPGGQAAYVQWLKSGTTWKDLDVVLMASDEYRTLHPPAEPFVTALYEDVLGRFPDAGGLADHSAQLGQDYARRARIFLDSGEHHERFVEKTYQSLLGRMPGSSELQFGASRLGQGMTLEAFVELVAASDEYYARQP